MGGGLGAGGCAQLALEPAGRGGGGGAQRGGRRRRQIDDVAGRAGIGTNTVSNLEAGRNVGFENLVRVAMVLGRTKELEALFLPKLESLDDIRRYEESATRQRIKRKPGHA